MIDRFGKHVSVGLSPVEIEWLKAAVSLPRRERMAAYREVAQMTGRKLSNVQHHAQRLVAQRRQEARAFLEVHLRKNWLAGCAPKSVMVPNARRVISVDNANNNSEIALNRCRQNYEATG